MNNRGMMGQSQYANSPKSDFIQQLLARSQQQRMAPAPMNPMSSGYGPEQEAMARRAFIQSPPNPQMGGLMQPKMMPPQNPAPQGGLMQPQMMPQQPMGQPGNGGFIDFNRQASKLARPSSQAPYSKDIMNIFSRGLPAQQANTGGGDEGFSDKEKKNFILSGGAVLPKKYRILF